MYFQPKIWESISDTWDWLKEVYLVCSGGNAQALSPGLLLAASLSLCLPSDPSGQPDCLSSESQGEAAPEGLPLCKVPLTFSQENEVNPVVLLLCRRQKALVPRSLALPPFAITMAISKPAWSLCFHNLLVWHSQGPDPARKDSGPLLREGTGKA